MYTFCSCDATMIPDVDHHQYFSFWDPWLQHYKRISRHTWTAFSSLTFICLLTCERAFFFDFFFYGSILMSERISGRHALRTSSHPRQQHTTSRSSLCWVSSSAGLHFLGDTGLRARHLYFYALLHSRRWLAALASSCFRAPGNLHSLVKLRFTASQKSKRTVLSMVMRAHAAMFPMK